MVKVDVLCTYSTTAYVDIWPLAPRCYFSKRQDERAEAPRTLAHTHTHTFHAQSRLERKGLKPECIKTVLTMELVCCQRYEIKMRNVSLLWCANSNYVVSVRFSKNSMLAGPELAFERKLTG